MHFKKQLIFFWSPVLTVDIWIEHINPSLAALSSNSIWEVVGNTNPLLGSKLLDLLSEDLILFICPQGVVRVHDLWFGTRRDEQLSVFDFLPPLEASNFRFVWHAFADPVPSVLAVLLDQVEQGKVLLLSPEHLVLRRFGLPFIRLLGTSIGAISSFVY
jgi:hypothetical protein